MVLNYEQLQRRLRDDSPWQSRLVIEPFFGEQRTPTVAASLDFHLGNRFTLLRSRRDVQHDPLSRFSPAEINEGARPRDVVTRELFIPMGDAFTIHPRQIVLGTTLEWYRFPPDLMAYVIGRSIWGRRGLLIVTAQAVHPLSSGTITLEMCNLGEVGLRLRPGVSIGQLVFHKVAPSKTAEDQKRLSGYSCTLRPTLGDYTPTDVESFLLWGLDQGRTQSNPVNVAQGASTQ